MSITIIRPALAHTNVGQSFEQTPSTQGKVLASESPVLPKVAAGDPAAVSECMNRYGNLVWSLAKRSCPDVQAAEDATQDIFLKIWKVAEKFDPKTASETSFIAMIARRSLIDLSRKRKWSFLAVEKLDGFTGSEMDAPERTELNDEAAKAARLLNELSTDQQRVIKLSVYDGMSHSRISETTGLSLGTVKTHMRRGILKLRKSFFSLNETTPKPTLAEGEASV